MNDVWFLIIHSGWINYTFKYTALVIDLVILMLTNVFYLLINVFYFILFKNVNLFLASPCCVYLHTFWKNKLKQQTVLKWWTCFSFNTSSCKCSSLLAASVSHSYHAHLRLQRLSLHWASSPVRERCDDEAWRVAQGLVGVEELSVADVGKTVPLALAPAVPQLRQPHEGLRVLYLRARKRHRLSYNALRTTREMITED